MSMLTSALSQFVELQKDCAGQIRSHVSNHFALRERKKHFRVPRDDPTFVSSSHEQSLSCFCMVTGTYHRRGMWWKHVVCTVLHQSLTGRVKKVRQHASYVYSHTATKYRLSCVLSARVHMQTTGKSVLSTGRQCTRSTDFECR